MVIIKPSFPEIYIDNVDEFLKENAVDASVTFGKLGIQSNASTAAPSGVQTPGRDPILLVQKELGRGAYSVVELVWDVSTGIEYAAKTIRRTRGID